MINDNVVLLLDDAGAVVVVLIKIGLALIDGCNDGDNIVLAGPKLLLLSAPLGSEEGDDNDDDVVVFDDGLALILGTVLIEGRREGGLVMVGLIVKEGDEVNDVTFDEDDTNVVMFDDGLALILGTVLIDGRREGDREYVGGPLLSSPPIPIP